MGDGTGCDNMTCIIIKFNQLWLANDHHDDGRCTTVDAKPTADSASAKCSNVLSNDSKTPSSTNGATCKGNSNAEMRNGDITPSTKRQRQVGNNGADDDAIDGTFSKRTKVE